MADQPLILIADDEPDILSVYKEKLLREGFRVISVENGADALARAITERPDLILMDMKMPVMDGIEAQEKLHANPSTKDLKVVFLTAFSDPARIIFNQEQAREIGATGIIRKGVGLDEFITKVKEFLAATG